MCQKNIPEQNIDCDNDSPVPKTFFKYCSDNEKVIRDIFEKNKIRFTQPAALNDPLELNPIIRFKNPKAYLWYVIDNVRFPSYQYWLRHQLIMTQYNNFGILSLTKIPDSHDMWSLYANGHQGFLLEFKADFNKDACMQGNENTVYDVRPVVYVKPYAFDVEDLVNENNDIVREGFNERLFYHKSNRWAKEDEWRMVRPLSDCSKWKQTNTKKGHDRKIYLFECSLDCLQSITFGACMSPKNKKKISEACKGKEIELFQAMIVIDVSDSCGHQGIVTRNKIDGISDFYDLPDIGVMAVVEDLKGMRKDPVQLTQPSELPYYKNNEKWVKQYSDRYRKSKKVSKPVS